MKKILLGLCLVIIVITGKAQNGLEGIIVEKYYVSNATDEANSGSYPLPAGSVTWRIYVDMLPGYTFQAAYGNTNHTLLMTTTTSFYNNSDFGNFTPAFSATNAKKSTVMLDSWLSVGGACNGYLGILKSEDNGVGTFVNSSNPKCLQNNNSSAGIPLTTQDGMIAGSVPAFASVGFTNETDVFNDGSANGNTFTTNNAAWSCLAGAVGPTPSNRVLIAQITTNGIFHYEINIQIGTPSHGTQNYVVSNPIPGEISDPRLHLSGTLNPAEALPTVSITAPTAGQAFNINDTISFTANADDADGTIAKVEYYVNNVKAKYYKKGAEVDTILTNAPYRNNWKSIAGMVAITAVATDFEGNQTTSAPVNITVGNISPTVSLTSPTANAHSITGDVVALAANAADVDGTITKVEFFVDGVSVGLDNTAPFTANYTGVTGIHSITAVATDNAGATTTSAAITLTVDTHSIPNISITAPAADASSFVGQTVAITANATGNDGSAITSVEFFVDGTSVGTDNAAPYTVNYVGVLGTHTLTAKATDNLGATATSAPVSITVNNNPPTINITAPLANDASVKVGHVVAITATAADIDGNVTSVEFKVNGTSLGSVTAAPYTINWTPATTGSISLTAIATDNNGGTTTSATVLENVLPNGIHDITSSGSTFMVYPNPANDAVTLDIAVSKPGKKSSYKIINLDGQVIIHKALGTITDKYLETINISSLAKGQYVIELSIDGNTFSSRLLKQ